MAGSWKWAEWKWLAGVQTGGGGSVCGRVGRQSALRWISGDTPLPLNCYSNHAKHTSLFKLKYYKDVWGHGYGPAWSCTMNDTREQGLCWGAWVVLCCVNSVGLQELRELCELRLVVLILCCDPGCFFWKWKYNKIVRRTLWHDYWWHIGRLLMQIKSFWWCM